jgi:hypothetical protein
MGIINPKLFKLSACGRENLVEQRITFSQYANSYAGCLKLFFLSHGVTINMNNQPYNRGSGR